MDGYSLWAASFAFPYDDELDDEESERVKEPTVTKRPQFVAGGSGGELALFCFAITGERSSENLSLIAGVKQHAAFPLKALPGSERLVPVWPGTSSPAFFTVRPTMQMAPKVPSDAKVTSSMTSHPGVASLSPRERFLYGLAQGLGFEGYDLVFDSENIVIDEARLSEDFTSIRMVVELADAAGVRRRAEVVVGPHRESSPSLATNAYTMPGLLWHFAHLFRTSDPMADEVVMSLLLGDLSDVGLKGVSIADWRGDFYMCISELLEALIKETLNESELNQGFYLGRGVADALRTTVDPARPARLDEIGKAEFLSRLKDAIFFSPKGRGDIALKRQASLIDGLKRFLGKSG